MGAAPKMMTEMPERLSDVPYQVKKVPVREAFQALSNGCRKFRNTGATFKLSFRSRKNPKQSCFIPFSAIKDSGVYPRISGELRYAERLPDNFCDSRLIWDHGRWFVHIPYREVPLPAETQGRVVALDPGVRTFLTGYCETTAFKLGAGAMARIARLTSHMDRLIGKMAKASCRKRRSMKKALNRMKWKVWNLIDELHFKSIRFLLDNFDLILLPTFETSNMVVKKRRKIRSKTVRAMMTLAHFRFKQRLKAAAIAAGKRVQDVCEAYTSKTASWTGEIVRIGGAKVIRSNGVSMDRDYNGARGIFLRALVDTPSLAIPSECNG